jgi:glycosyltransferase involved in cell wall biosynthesis
MRTLVVNALRLVGPRTAMGRYIEVLALHWSRSPSPFDRVVFLAPHQADIPQLDLGTHTEVSFRPHGWSVPLVFWEQVLLPWDARGASLLYCPAYVAPIVFDGPVVVANHGIYESIPTEFSNWRRWRTTPLHRASVRGARRVIANSQSTKKDIVRHLGASESKIDVVYPAPADIFLSPVDPSDVEATVVEILGRATPYILFVGKLSPRRNVPLLIEAFASVRSERDLPHKLLIVGPNTGDVAVRDLADSLGVAGHVLYYPHLDHEKLAHLYAGADAFVLPTTAEGISWTMFEAMASGAPVLTVDHAALQEGAGDAVMRVPSASLADLVNGLRTLLTDRSLRDAYAEKGRTRAQQFTWSRAAADTARILDGAALASDRRKGVAGGSAAPGGMGNSSDTRQPNSSSKAHP